MGVYIKGMEMPKEGNETILRLMPDGTVLDQYGHHLALKAVPVPPHGRLIDADALANKHRTMAYEDGGRKYSFHASAKAWVEEAPTIIPAETEKEGE